VGHLRKVFNKTMHRSCLCRRLL